ncbi:MAG: hypothetical protein KDA32_09555, partial [Phycisphaerales bacterium]|nr:hypothetical protein [Phycisphaerales bacterium]
GSGYRSEGTHDRDGNPLIPHEQYTRLTDIVRPSTLIFLTEAHTSLPSDTLGLHDVMLANQLPFGSFPRIASDRRHPRGITALFFDGHADVMPLNELDAGWPTTLDLRLRYLTTFVED